MHVPYQNRKCTRRVGREGRRSGWIEAGKLSDRDDLTQVSCHLRDWSAFFFSNQVRTGMCLQRMEPKIRPHKINLYLFVQYLTYRKRTSGQPSTKNTSVIGVAILWVFWIVAIHVTTTTVKFLIGRLNTCLRGRRCRADSWQPWRT